MAHPGPKHVFISYVTEDTEQVDRLCLLLEAAGIPFWRDRKDLAAGDDWKAVIREAIRSGSIAFVACFSDNSRARDVTHMNEELTLAVEEYRKRPPGATWLFPVRFDAGPIPAWELSTGKILSDLNYVDLFGQHETIEATKLLTSINRLLGGPSLDASSVRASAAEASPAARPSAIRRLTKEWVPDHARRIDLDELVAGEARRIVSELNDESRLTLSMPAGSEAEHIRFLSQRTHQLWKLTEPLATSFQVAARFAEGDTITTYSSALRTVARASFAARSGNTAIWALHAVPALGLLATTAVAAIEHGRWDIVRRVIADPQVPDRFGRPEPLILAAHPWSPFRDDRVAQGIARAEVEGCDPWDAIDRPRERYRSPVSAWLEHILRPLFEDQFAEESEFIAAFERAELMLGGLSQDSSNEQTRKGGFGAGPGWYGRSLWSSRLSGVNPVAEIHAELHAAGEEWPPLRAGLFGGAYQRADSAFSNYEENFTHVQRSIP